MISESKQAVTIAIVDDDESILDSLQMVLDNQGWNTKTYLSGEAFLADFENIKPDCIILDSHFPGLDGAEVVKSIDVVKTNIPVIVLTAYPKSLLTNEIMDLGAREVLVKPITAEVLIDHIQTMVSSVE